MGLVVRWWGLLAVLGFVCFLAYGWEFSAEGVTYALIAGLVASCAVVAGSLLRRGLRWGGGADGNRTRRLRRPD